MQKNYAELQTALEKAGLEKEKFNFSKATARRSDLLRSKAAVLGRFEEGALRGDHQLQRDAHVYEAQPLPLTMRGARVRADGDALCKVPHQARGEVLKLVAAPDTPHAECARI